MSEGTDILRARVSRLNVTRAQVTGWTSAIAVITVLSAALPAIGSKSIDQRTQANWTEAAMAFAAYDGAGETVDLTSPRLADLSDIEPLSPLRATHRRWAESRAAEATCLAEAVYYEARSESRSGQLAVADVVKNRVKSKHYPNTICDVVYQGAENPFACQFSFACDGSMDHAPQGRAWDRAQAIAQVSITGHVPDLTKNSTHYHTVQVNPKWADTLEFKAQIGFHKFYRPSWRERGTSTVAINIAPPT